MENIQFPTRRCQTYVTVRLAVKCEEWRQHALGLVLRSHQVCEQD